MNYINVFSICIPVKGYCRSAIYDLQLNKFHFIPNMLQYILLKFNGRKLDELYDNYKNEKLIINEYVDFLLKNRIIFLTEKNEKFPSLNFSINNQSHLNSYTYTLSEKTEKYFSDFIGYLNELNCKAIRIIVFDDFNINGINKYIENAILSNFQHVELFIPFEKFLHSQIYFDLNDYDSCLSAIYVYNIKKESISKICNKFNTLKHVLFFDTSEVIDILNFKRNFIVNQKFFIESLWFNPYFNSKIFIDENGTIKNSMECLDSYGNIQEIKSLQDLMNVIENTSLSIYWKVNKDICDVCMDCEFRYMCSDNRVPTKGDGVFWFYKTSCHYNPYISKWSNEEGFITVEEWRKQNPNWEKKAKRKPLVKIPQKVE